MWEFPSGSAVKNSPAMQEIWVQPLGQENPWEEEMATHSSIPAWRIPWTEESGGLQVHGVTMSQTWLSDWPSPCIQKMILEHVTHFRESNELSCIFCVFSLERAFLHFQYFSVRTGNFQRLGTMCSARRGYKQVPGDVGSHFLWTPSSWQNDTALEL